MGSKTTKEEVVTNTIERGRTERGSRERPRRRTPNSRGGSARAPREGDGMQREAGLPNMRGDWAART